MSEDGTVGAGSLPYPTTAMEFPSMWSHLITDVTNIPTVHVVYVGGGHYFSHSPKEMMACGRGREIGVHCCIH